MMQVIHDGETKIYIEEYKKNMYEESVAAIAANSRKVLRSLQDVSTVTLSGSLILLLLLEWGTCKC